MPPIDSLAAGFLDRDFCLRLTCALVHLVWQGALVGAASALVAVSLRHRAASLRYALHVAALFTLAACLPVTYLAVDTRPVSQVNDRPADVLRTAAQSAPAAASRGGTIARVDGSPGTDALLPEPLLEGPLSAASAAGVAQTSDPPHAIQRPGALSPTARLPFLPSYLVEIISPFAAAFYFAGVFVMSLRLLLALRGGQVLRHSAEVVTDPHLLALIHRQARRMGLKAAPLVAWCRRVSTPVVVGVITPVILLPASLVGGISPEQLAPLLAHELAHIRRFDLVVNLLQRVVEAALFFHPAVWYISRQISRERENCCDDLVVSAGWPRSTYAAALVRMAELCTLRPVCAAAAVLAASGERPSEFKRRVLRLMEVDEDSPLRLSRTGVATMALALIAAFTGPAVVREMAVAQNDSGAPAVAAEGAAGIEQRTDNTDERASPQDRTAPPAEWLLTVTGRVVLPDGSPAQNAIVRTTTYANEDQPTAARTNDAGEFRLVGNFGYVFRLHALSADGRQQTARILAAGSVRAAAASGITLTLQPAVPYEVSVTAEGKPMAGAQVVARGFEYQVSGTTDAQGKVQLLHPANLPIRELVAWHPTAGVAGMRNLEEGFPGNAAISLKPPTPHTIRVMDPLGDPVAGVELAIHVRTDDSEWILTGLVGDARVRTDAAGSAIVPWMPREKLKFVDIQPTGSDWKLDKRDISRLHEGVSTIQVRRRHTVLGRVVMPEGANAEGLLITGNGFGKTEMGDGARARVRGDGFFRLEVPSQHTFVLGIDDLEWASNLWSDVILATDTAEPARVILEAYPATPLVVRVTRGANHKPVADAWVDLSSKDQEGRTGVHGWLRTDEKGEARAGVGLGEIHARLDLKAWNEKRTIKIGSSEPVTVEFHRKWEGDRRVTGRLTRAGAPFKPSPTAVARAWAPQPGIAAVTFPSAIRPDGTLEVSFDAEKLAVSVIDPEQKQSGYVEIGANDAPVELAMRPTATYTGTLFDGLGQPLPDRTLKLYFSNSGFQHEASPAQTTDLDGRFRFEAVPAQVELFVSLVNEPGRSEYYLTDYNRLFQPGETRSEDALRLRPPNNNAAQIAAPVPLAERLPALCRDARLNGMHVLAILQGDDSDAAVRTATRLLDYDAVPEVLGYLTVRITPDRITADAKSIAELGWPTPKPDQLVLVALDGRQKLISSERIDLKRNDAAGAQGAAFLKRHGPAARDALALFEAAREEARASGRRVWLVEGGPRCGPCFRLARWLDDHRATLEKDYLVVKVLGSIDRNTTELIKRFGSTSHGIPWFAVIEPDEKILITSDGPLGNIGVPVSVEELRHLRRMIETTAQKITPDEIDTLLKSLSPGKSNN
ncbi:MAG: M56 family metallopeptidase [Planctomycetaceae bacterium]